MQLEHRASAMTGGLWSQAAWTEPSSTTLLCDLRQVTSLSLNFLFTEVRSISSKELGMLN